VKYDLPDELTVETDGPVRTVVINRAARLAAQPPEALRSTKRVVNMHLSQVLGGPLQAGFAAEVVTMQSDEHRDRLLAFKQKADRK
jgi:enoyl-CoA hydratase